MKVNRETNDKGKTEIHIVLTLEDAELSQTAVLQFAENIANRKSHQARMRRLAILIDKQL